MRFLVACKTLLLMFIFLTTLLAHLVASSAPTANSSPLVAVPHPLNVRATNYQLDPSKISWPPDCATQDSKTCLGSAAVKSCTIEECSKRVALTCWTHVYFIDLSCLCKSMSSTTCPSCNNGINHELYLAWLSVYCSMAPGWGGLRKDWSTGLPGYETLEAGSINTVKTVDPSRFQTNNPFTSQFITDKHTFNDDHRLPSCTFSCNWLNLRWKAAWTDGNVAATLGGANVFQPSYTIGGAPQSGKLYIDLSVFCTGWEWGYLQSNCTGLCKQGLDPTSLLLWLNKTCGKVKDFTGLPTGWEDSVATVNSTFADPFRGPSCLQNVNDANCQIGATVSSCTKTLCGSTNQNGDCSAVSKVNMECFCSQVKYSGCIAGSGPCSSSLTKTGLLLWLNATCSNVKGFVGLSDNWRDSLSVDNSTYSNVFQQPSCVGGSDFPGCGIGSTESSCIRTLCSSVDANGECSTVSKVDKSCFCSQASYSNCTTVNGPCSSDLSKTGLLLWINSTCSSVSGFPGMPSNWVNSLSVINSTYTKGDALHWPDCLSIGNHSDCQLDSVRSNCTKTLCSHIDGRGDCSSESLVDMSCFCSKVKYGTSCKTNCGLSWERTSYLDWLNSTCSVHVALGISLPVNWTSLLSVQRFEMLPWSWELASDLHSGSSSAQCPSASGKLLVFAAVNIAMFLLLPVIGRRTVIKKLSCGVFGQKEIQRWYYTGPIGAGLHLASNAINAAIIKGTPGFDKTSIKDLTLFWCTRPRLSWLIAALLPIQAKDTMYLSAATSILFSEAILQLFAGYYMGVGADFARRQNFFHKGYLVGSWYAKQAMIMYAGSILWLTAVPIAIVACIWTVFGLSGRIGWLNKDWTEVKRTANKYSGIGAEEQGKLLELKSRIKLEGEEAWQREMARLQNDLFTEIDATRAGWDVLNTAWGTLYKELHDEQKERRAVKRELKRARDRLKDSQEGTREWQELYQAREDAEAAESASDRAWNITTPTRKRHKANEYCTGLGTQIASNKQRKNEVEVRLAACEIPIQQQLLRTIVESWGELVKRNSTLQENWAAYEDQWRLIAEKREDDEVKRPKVKHFPYVVVFGMLLCWIAQWLWWAGFVGVAGDKYCPPKLPLLAFIWTLFSSIGAIQGTSI
ncbi:hypothetical protein BGZ60DRAFT_524415 [Tricladium varicosporioides]|nr:hypothetical protein BGZ60DRAFT_524415 [Hymenoscyphus varicosporioides]